MRPSAIISVAVVLLISASFAAALVPFAAPAQNITGSHPLIYEAPMAQVSSTNWSGYAITASVDSVTYAAGSWVVPAVTCTSQTTYVAAWVGIDGYSSSTVEQTGTLSWCDGGVAQYYAWYEFYPNPMYEITAVPVSPGDTISASVTYSGSTFTVTLTDVNSGKSYSTSATVSSAQRSSAEWIIEAPSSGNSILPLANFGTAYFGQDTTSVSSTCYATIGGTTGTLASFGSSVEDINMVTKSGSVQSQPSALSSDGTSFSVAFVGATTSTSTTSTSTTHSSTTVSTTSTTSTSTVTTATGTQLVVTVTTNEGSYSPGSRVTITVTVKSPGGSAVNRASVSITVTPPSGRASTGSGRTGSSGTETFTYSLSRSAVAGTYSVSASATASGYSAGSGSTTFSVT